MIEKAVMKISSRSDSFRTGFRWVSAVVIFVSALSFSSSIANMNPAVLPQEYGEVVFQYNPKSPNQIYIIGMTHRDSLTRQNGDNTSRVQAEVYKIGEWLIQYRGLELLLPEGFFAGTGPLHKGTARTAATRVSPQSLDIKKIEARLSDRDFVNAEMLLMKNHGLRTEQVEDPALYKAVGDLILQLSTRGPSCDVSQVKSDLDFLQEMRTAAMLQKIPGIVDGVFQSGAIDCRAGLFTIGISHIPKIIQYLNEGRIQISSPATGVYKNEKVESGLNLAKGDFGVCVILPRTLASDPKVLQVNNLGQILENCRK